MRRSQWPERSALDDLPLADFENPALRATYLAHYRAEMLADYEHEKGRAFTLVWKHGFMRAVPFDWGREAAEVWGVVFVWTWLRGMKCWNAERLASKIAMPYKRAG